jgi:hypothetical protein
MAWNRPPDPPEFQQAWTTYKQFLDAAQAADAWRIQAEADTRRWMRTWPRAKLHALKAELCSATERAVRLAEQHEALRQHIKAGGPDPDDLGPALPGLLKLGEQLASVRRQLAASGATRAT